MSIVPATASNTTADLRLIALPEHHRDDGSVVVAETFVHIPYTIARVFTLQGPVGSRRGHHAHRLCSQFMVCVHGAVDIICDDGSERRTFTLDQGNQALLVPPMIWNVVEFRQPASVIAVMCDRHYEEHDYVRDYSEFLKLRQVE